MFKPHCRSCKEKVILFQKVKFCPKCGGTLKYPDEETQ